MCSAFGQSPRRREWKVPMRHVAVVEDSRLPTRELLTDVDTYEHRDLEVETICARFPWI